MILTHLDIFVGTLTLSHLYIVKLVLYLSCPILPNCKNVSNSTHTIVAMVVKQQIETNLYVSPNPRTQIKSSHCFCRCLCHCLFKCNFRDIQSNVAMILSHRDVFVEKLASGNLYVLRLILIVPSLLNVANASDSIHAKSNITFKTFRQMSQWF